MTIPTSTSPDYDTLNKLYDKSTTFQTTNGYKATVGGTRAGSIFAGPLSQDQKVGDDATFADFSRYDGVIEKLDDSNWKIHLSVHPEDLGKAWDYVKDDIFNCVDLQQFKITRLNVIENKHGVMKKFLHSDKLPNEKRETIEKFKKNATASELNLGLEDEDRVKNGMQITFYIKSGDEEGIQKLSEKIEKKWLEMGIRPGVVHSSDNPIGVYTSIRQEIRGDDKIYVSYKSAPYYTDGTIPMPFTRIEKIKPESLDQNVLQKMDFKLLGETMINRLHYYIEQRAIDPSEKSILHKDAASMMKTYFNYWHTLLNKLEPLRPSQSGDDSPISEPVWVKFKDIIDFGYAVFCLNKNLSNELLSRIDHRLEFMDRITLDIRNKYLNHPDLKYEFSKSTKPHIDFLDQLNDLLKTLNSSNKEVEILKGRIDKIYNQLNIPGLSDNQKLTKAIERKDTYWLNSMERGLHWNKSCNRDHPTNINNNKK